MAALDCIWTTASVLDEQLRDEIRAFCVAEFERRRELLLSDIERRISESVWVSCEELQELHFCAARMTDSPCLDSMFRRSLCCDSARYLPIEMARRVLTYGEKWVTSALLDVRSEVGAGLKLPTTNDYAALRQQKSNSVQWLIDMQNLRNAVERLRECIDAGQT